LWKLTCVTDLFGVFALTAPQTSTCFSVPPERYVSNACAFAFTASTTPVAFRSISCAADATFAAASAVTTTAVNR
jgi:hypothetical protein